MLSLESHMNTPLDSGSQSLQREEAISPGDPDTNIIPRPHWPLLSIPPTKTAISPGIDRHSLLSIQRLQMLGSPVHQVHRFMPPSTS